MAHRKTVVHSWTEFERAIDGRTVTIDGVSGKICIVHWAGRRSAIVFKPNRKGKATAAYQKVRKQLGDDWDTVLTDSDRLDEIARRAGVVYE